MGETICVKLSATENTPKPDSNLVSEPEKDQKEEEKPQQSTKTKKTKKDVEKKATKVTPETEKVDEPVQICDKARENWTAICLPEVLLPGVAKFEEPTPVQKQAL